MPVSPEYREFVLEQLGRVAPSVTARAMFGAVGVYSAGVFFAVVDDDTTFLKVDETTRGEYEAAGMGPFRPYGDDRASMQYYELPADLLEDADRLRPWVDKAIDVARRKRKKK